MARIKFKSGKANVNLEEILAIAKKYVEEGNFQGAIEKYRSLLDTKYDIEARLALADLEFKLGNIASARRYCINLAKNEKHKSEALFQLGIIELKIGHSKEARDCFKESFELGNVRAMLELGKIDFSEGNISDAIKAFMSLRNTSIWLDARLELGKVEFYRGNIDGARKHFCSLLNGKKKVYASVYLAIIYLKQGDLSASLELIKNLKDEDIPSDLKDSVNSLKLYFSKTMQIEFGNFEFNDNYNNRQMRGYDESAAIEHISSRHSDEIPQGVSLSEFRERISSKFRVGLLEVNDIYDIHCKTIDGTSRVIRVITLPHSKDILTMYSLDKKGKRGR